MAVMYMTVFTSMMNMDRTAITTLKVVILEITGQRRSSSTVDVSHSLLVPWSWCRYWPVVRIGIEYLDGITVPAMVCAFLP